MNPTDIIAKIRARACLTESAPVGVVSSYCKQTSVDDAAGKRDIISLVNTLDIDSDREVVMPGGADMTYALANRQVFVDHQYGTNTAVGHMRSIVRYPRQGEQWAWEARTGVYKKLGNTIGDDILVMARECGIGASVGFFATDYGPPTPDEVKYLTRMSVSIPQVLIRKWKMLEYSLTAFPCNVTCQGHVVGGAEVEKRIGIIDEMVTKSRIRRMTASVLGAPITERRKLFAVSEPKPRRRLVVV